MMIYELFTKNVTLVVSTIFRTLPLNISSSWQVSTHSTPDLPADGQHVQRAAITEGVAAVVRSDLASFRLSFVQDCLLRPHGGVAVCHIKMIQQSQVIGRFKLFTSVISESDVHETVHRDLIINTTNEMKLYKLIYYF
jgi:hypothetical protein